MNKQFVAALVLVIPLLAQLAFPFILAWPVQCPVEQHPEFLGLSPYWRWICTWVSDPTAIFTYWIFVVTAFLAGYTYNLWSAAVEQGRIAQLTFVLDKRAFVYPTGVLGESEWDPTDNEYKWRLKVSVRNSGDTETMNFAASVQCMVSISELPTGSPIPNLSVEPAYGFIPPHFELYSGPAPAPPLVALKAGDIVDAIEGKKFIYLIGRMAYFDVFPQTPAHVTEFCWRIQFYGDPRTYDPSVTAPYPASGAMAFGYLQHHAEHNQMRNELGMTKEWFFANK